MKNKLKGRSDLVFGMEAHHSCQALSVKLRRCMSLALKWAPSFKVA